jgi:hypothetical protein
MSLENDFAEILKAALIAGTLGNDKAFVESLLKAHATKGLTLKQSFWFGKMAGKHGGKPQEEAAPVPAPIVGQFEGVYTLFAKAKEHLKFPKINLKLADGSSVVLSMAGPKSKKPGVINVTNGGKFKAPGSKWYGRVNTDGSMETPGSHAPEFEEVKAVLKSLAAEPAKVAAEHGKLSGHCCFCNHKLTDKDKSTAVGYGPTCAKNFGLYAEWKAGENFFETVAKATSGLDEAALTAVGLKETIIKELTKPFPVEPFVSMDPANFNFDKATVGVSVPKATIDKLEKLAEELEEKAARPVKPVVTAVPAVKDEDYLF